MSKYPKLKFIIDRDEEIKIYFSFLKDAKYHSMYREMKWAFYNPHPALKILRKKNLSFRQRKKIIQDYVYNYYRMNLSEIKKNTLLIKKQWQLTEGHFFQLVNKIFKNHPWPKGKYVAYPTIWGMYPRDVREKTLWFPFKHNIKNYLLITISHEMLHFIFYDYLYKHYPKYKNHKYDFQVWTISEAFNVIIQNQKEWLKIFYGSSSPYPEHKNLIKRMNKIWQEKEGIDYLLERIL